jgi:hypothetical protein
MTKEEILDKGFIEDFNSMLKDNIPRSSDIVYQMFSSIYEDKENFYSNVIVERYNKIQGNIYLEKIIKPGYLDIYTVHQWQDKNCIYIAPYINDKLLEFFKFGCYIKRNASK